MADFNKSYIPKNLDVPEKFLIWGYDQLAFFVIGSFIGNMISGINTAIVLGIVTAWLYSKFLRRGAHPSFWKHLLFWFLPESFGSIFNKGQKLKKTPPSVLRRWIL
jgi:type IV conjugative transfer system protein TraL